MGKNIDVTGCSSLLACSKSRAKFRACRCASVRLEQVRRRLLTRVPFLEKSPPVMPISLGPAFRGLLTCVIAMNRLADSHGRSFEYLWICMRMYFVG